MNSLITHAPNVFWTALVIVVCIALFRAYSNDNDQEKKENDELKRSADAYASPQMEFGE